MGVGFTVRVFCGFLEIIIFLPEKTIIFYDSAQNPVKPNLVFDFTITFPLMYTNTSFLIPCAVCSIGHLFFLDL